MTVDMIHQYFKKEIEEMIILVRVNTRSLHRAETVDRARWCSAENTSLI